LTGLRSKLLKLMQANYPMELKCRKRRLDCGFGLLDYCLTVSINGISMVNFANLQ
jgi:hypothetical protein